MLCSTKERAGGGAGVALSVPTWKSKDPPKSLHGTGLKLSCHSRHGTILILSLLQLLLLLLIIHVIPNSRDGAPQGRRRRTMIRSVEALDMPMRPCEWNQWRGLVISQPWQSVDQLCFCGAPWNPGRVLTLSSSLFFSTLNSSHSTPGAPLTGCLFPLPRPPWSVG